jgi:transposase-like protein
VNHCKNPLCLNFGCPASSERQPRRANSIGRDRDAYTLKGDKGGTPKLLCNLCSEKLPVKSNLAISEELQRLSKYMNPAPETTCPVITCQNYTIGVTTPKAYQSFGTTTAGAKRYRCRACGKTFSVNSDPASRQRFAGKNEEIFRFLVNKVPLKRMSELADVAMGTLYRKINFIHRQCLAFAAKQELRLPDLHIDRLYLSVDRQIHIVNWKHTGEKRNIILNALGTADNKSSYIFGIHVNFDPYLNAEQVEKDAVINGDDLLSPPFRRYARVWLQQDYTNAIGKSNRKRSASKYLRDRIQNEYDNSSSREDIEESEIQTLETGLPCEGMQIHSEYTMYGHFLFLKHLLRNVGKLRFFMDQESGIRAACLSGFWQEVLEKRCDAFYVRINKDLTVGQKRRLTAKSKKELSDFRASSAAYTQLTDHDLRHFVIKEHLEELVDIGDWNDRWLFYPFPDMSEPEKAICWLTDLQDRAYDDDHLAWLYSKGTLHGIDRFFMQARRRLSLLERPISSASSEGRKWHGYSPYNPAMVGKALDIFRVFYNFVEVGKDKKTPAMRLGLTIAPVSINDIVSQ